MRLKRNITAKNLTYTAITAAASAVFYKWLGISIFHMILLPLLMLAVQNVEVEFHKTFEWFFGAVLMGAGSMVTAWLIQYLLLAEDLRKKLSSEKFFLNACCCLAVYLVVRACINQAGIACATAHGILMAFAGVNYFVYDFRGNELTYGDLTSAFTGLSVASHYQFSLDARAADAVLLSVVFAAAALKFKIKSRYTVAMCVLCLSLTVLSIIYVAGRIDGMATETWEQKGTYRNGYLLNFALSMRDSFVQKPASYLAEAVAELEEAYRPEDGQEEKTDGKKPTVIAIMNESFADLRIFGDLETNQPVMPFFDSLTENTVKGYALSSVYGAKTPNSEWEFLSGNSMAYLPTGSVAYQQYVKKKNAYSILDALKKENYTCVAMHPYHATGWSRDTVYQKFGFDEMYFLEDFDQGRLMRNYVSDEAMYQKIIERYEESQGKEPLFLMGITMQNHGGYTDFYEDFETDVYGSNFRYPDADQYLSLIHQSDLALKELIGYFSNMEEPVVICFFGDHQPSLNSSFYRRLNGKGLSGLSLGELEEFYQVPFFIWTNYESESMENLQVSFNFLSALLFEKAGIALSPYQQFLADLNKVVPAMNPRGYYSKNLKRFVHYGEGAMEEESWIEKYRILQYNGLFDDRGRSRLFFERE